MLQYPNTIVAASGDAEVELSSEKSPQFGGAPIRSQPALLADYSPFAIAEFRDWLRGTDCMRPASRSPGKPIATAPATLRRPLGPR